ncbi:hypothetical protein HAX54_004984, partial [Datura stramonium]|nr:hypothetical protein [Datura stramonium]
GVKKILKTLALNSKSRWCPGRMPYSTPSLMDSRMRSLMTEVTRPPVRHGYGAHFGHSNDNGLGFGPLLYNLRLVSTTADSSAANHSRCSESALAKLIS